VRNLTPTEKTALGANTGEVYGVKLIAQSLNTILEAGEDTQILLDLGTFTRAIKTMEYQCPDPLNQMIL